MAVKTKTEELIEAAKKTSLINRGQYPVTKASNVYKEDGTSLEKSASDDKGTEDSK